MGNIEPTLWRDTQTQSLQNRIGLKNPGALAAATFLENKKKQLSREFGINLAPTPKANNEAEDEEHIIDSLNIFLQQNINPLWITLNVSCPNTEDDQTLIQTEKRVSRLCELLTTALVAKSNNSNKTIPLWVKIGPDLTTPQYQMLMRVFHETNVKAVIATNTIGQLTPEGNMIAGVSGGLLHRHSLDVADLLAREITQHDYAIDLVVCGGVQDKETYNHFFSSQELKQTVKAIQYLTALVYHGPLFVPWLLKQLKE